MILPAIHLNGSSAANLAEANDTARAALRAAIDAMSDAAPNARDYYPMGTDAFSVAMKEHTARLAKLQDVLNDLNTVREYLAEAANV